MIFCRMIFFCSNTPLARLKNRNSDPNDHPEPTHFERPLAVITEYIGKNRDKHIFLYQVYKKIQILRRRFILLHQGRRLQDDIQLRSHSDQSPTPWYLSLKGAVPEAACSWLVFLHDTQSVDLHYQISVKRLSFDYLPRDVTRPFSTANRRAFLTTLTVLGVQWRDRGADGIFVGRSPENEIEITAADIPSIGIQLLILNF